MSLKLCISILYFATHGKSTSQVLSTADRWLSPVYHNKHPALCTECCNASRASICGGWDFFFLFNKSSFLSYAESGLDSHWDNHWDNQSQGQWLRYHSWHSVNDTKKLKAHMSIIKSSFILDSLLVMEDKLCHNADSDTSCQKSFLHIYITNPSALIVVAI